MNNFSRSMAISVVLGVVCAQSAWAGVASQSEQATRTMAHDIFKQLIEINTTDSVGSVTAAAQAMAQRLRDGGFPAGDVTLAGPNDRKENMVARYRGRAGSKLRPILIIGHLDVVEARREDWTTDPFQFVEKDGYYYGRGTQDMKDSDAIMMSAGHAPNALPQKAEANVNCRIFPGHSQEEIRLELVKLFNDPKLSVRYKNDAGEVSDHGSDRKAMVPPPLRPDVIESLRGTAGKLWPGVPVIPIMEPGASDSIYTMMAGIPSYGISGVAIDRDDVRMHGKDERVPIESYTTGVEFYYEFLKTLTTRKN